MVGYVAVGAAILALGWVVHAFNRLVRLANLVREAWSGIDVQLKRRHDLVPNLVEVVKSYASFEKGVLEETVRLRGEGRAAQASAELEERENSLASRLRSVLVVAEAYPELRANRSFLDLQAQLAEIENHLQIAATTTAPCATTTLPWSRSHPTWSLACSGTTSGATFRWRARPNVRSRRSTCDERGLAPHYPARPRSARAPCRGRGGGTDRRLPARCR
jgi:LemA protein